MTDIKNRILIGDCRHILPTLPAESVHTVVTSPPHRRHTNTDIMTKRIVLPYLTPGLNGPDGLMRNHYKNVAKVKERIAWEIRGQKEGPTITEPVRVTYIRHTARLMDWDNACASFKHIGDAMIDAGIIADDSPKIIAEFVPRQIKCQQGEQRTEIIIEKI